ncbi:MAG: hypothetical protein ABI273_12780 [Lacunisphaera sp.]
MKTKITALALAVATALALTPKPAAASDKGLAIVGGFIGGLIVASAINDSYHNSPARPAIVVDDRCDTYTSNGYWRDVTVQVWVPACWVVERGYRGYDSRRYIAGHYEGRNNRVWVTRDRHDDRGRDANYGRGRR